MAKDMFGDILKGIVKGDPEDFCPLCGRKVGKGNYSQYGCSECADMEDLK